MLHSFLLQGFCRDHHGPVSKSRLAPEMRCLNPLRRPELFISRGLLGSHVLRSFVRLRWAWLAKSTIELTTVYHHQQLPPLKGTRPCTGSSILIRIYGDCKTSWYARSRGNTRNMQAGPYSFFVMHKLAEICRRCSSSVGHILLQGHVSELCSLDVSLQHGLADRPEGRQYHGATEFALLQVSQPEFLCLNTGGRQPKENTRAASICA